MVNNMPPESRRATNSPFPAADPSPTGGRADPQRAIAVSLAVDAVVPIAVFHGPRPAGVEQWTALMLGAVLSLPTGSPRAMLARDGWITAVVGAWIRFTLLRTPYYLYVLRVFTGGTLRARINAARCDSPAFRRVCTWAR